VHKVQSVAIIIVYSISGSRQSVNMDYVPYVRHLMTAPLVKEGASGVDQTVSLLHAYDLLREDFDSILEVSSWTSTQDIMSHVDSKVRCCCSIWSFHYYVFSVDFIVVLSQIKHFVYSLMFW